MKKVNDGSYVVNNRTRYYAAQDADLNGDLLVNVAEPEHAQIDGDIIQGILEDEDVDFEIFSDLQLPGDDHLDSEDEEDPPNEIELSYGSLQPTMLAGWRESLTETHQVHDRVVTADPNCGRLVEIVDSKGVSQHYTAKKYRQKAKFSLVREWRRMRIQEDVNIGQIELQIASSHIGKTQVPEYVLAMKLRLQHYTCRDRFFNERHDFRGKKFQIYIGRQEAFEDIADLFTCNGQYKNVLVGYGNWSGTRNFKLNCAKPPVLALRSFLIARFEAFWLLDEYRTSCKCSSCLDGRMKNCYVPWTNSGMFTDLYPTCSSYRYG